MRELFALTSLLLLVALGWQQPFSVRVDRLLNTNFSKPTAPGEGAAESETLQGRPASTPVPQRDTTWMYKKTIMDEAYNKRGVNGR